MRSKGLLVEFLLVSARKTHSAANRRAIMEDCGDPIPGADEVLRSDSILLLGDPHPSAEVPEFVGTLACLAAQRGSMAVGLLKSLWNSRGRKAG